MPDIYFAFFFIYQASQNLDYLSISSVCLSALYCTLVKELQFIYSYVSELALITWLTGAHYSGQP